MDPPINTSQSPENKYVSTFYQDWPKITSIDPADIKLLCKKIMPRKYEVHLNHLIYDSDRFRIKFPIDTVRCKELQDKTSQQQLTRNVNSTYPLLHEKTLELYIDFLKFKRKYGSDVERSLYYDMNIVELVQRLLTCRAIAFYGSEDKYRLITMERGKGGWEFIGTEKERPPLTFDRVISYDEIKLSSLLYVSGYTQFINDGNRNNTGRPATNNDRIQEDGIVIGLVGTRLSQNDIMEYEEIIVTRKQNTQENGYGPPNENAPHLLKKQKWRQLWADFYQEPNNLYETVVSKYNKSSSEKNFIPAKRPKTYFDICYYKKRLSLAIDTLLFEANERAKEANKMAYVHMVGIGLGVWKNNDQQQDIFAEVFAQRLKYLKDNVRNISDVHFAYFRFSGENEITDDYQFSDKEHKLGGVRVHVSNREPSSRLRGDHRDKLLVVTYPRTGNAQPGNEFWFGFRNTTGDSAAACSTQVAELHNPHINTPNVCGDNLRIASRKYGIIHIAEYASKLKEMETKVT